MDGVFDPAAEVTTYIDSFRSNGLPLIGKFGNAYSDGDPDEATILVVRPRLRPAQPIPHATATAESKRSMSRRGKATSSPNLPRFPATTRARPSRPGTRRSWGARLA
jgi:hypothetical protein